MLNIKLVIIMSFIIILVIIVCPTQVIKTTISVVPHECGNKCGHHHCSMFSLTQVIETRISVVQAQTSCPDTHWLAGI